MSEFTNFSLAGKVALVTGASLRMTARKLQLSGRTEAEIIIIKHEETCGKEGK